MRAILFDLDGVLYVGDQAIDGAAEVLDWVREMRIPHLFLTNTTSRPRSAIVTRLAAMGIAVDEAEILTPPVAATAWIVEQKAEPVALFLPQATGVEFSGLELLDEGLEEGAGAVVVGDLGEAWDFSRLNRAFRLLMGGSRPALVALGMTRYWRAPDGLRLDTAPFVMALSHAAGTEPQVMGKPSPAFFRVALGMLGVPAREVVMIGDDIRGDVAGAQAAGIKGLLVKTGKFQPGDLQGDITPDGILDSVAGLPQWWSVT
ncbi:MAG: TIGR01458 family HAD-type hydrolase [Sedimenticola sp.]